MYLRSIALAGALLIVAAGSACATLARHHQPQVRLVLEIVAAPADRAAVVKTTITIIESRLNALGLVADVKPQGAASDGRIVVTAWRAADVARLEKVVTETGKLELAHVISNASPAPPQTYATKAEAISALDKMPADRRVLPYTERSDGPRATKWVIVESPAIVDGSDLRNAVAFPSRYQDAYEISFSLRSAGAERLGKWTGANINEYLAVVLNDEVKSVAFIKSQIFDQGEINGNFTKQSAEDLALILNSGSLPFPVRVVDRSN